MTLARSVDVRAGVLVSVSRMNEAERWNHILSLDEELLKGGVILSEWCSFIVRESDSAFVHGANLASILTAVSGIETYLRSEYAKKERSTLFELINDAPIADDLRFDLHTLRKYRNKWVHVNDPWDDQSLIDTPEEAERELEEMALFAARALRRTIYENQWV
ncbi:hypothetical protein [Alloalcanivorax venustensis]|jgi:hypothetical protein|uniref:hypothetical protein n=1 Tax=Alloalcanivorax venustensis TaxID=172371 RepID=UPI003519CAC2